MRLACFQRHALYDDPDAVICRLYDDLAWAGRQGVAMAVFPESYLHGHAYDLPTVKRRAIETDGPEIRKLLAGLAAFPFTIVLGLFTRHGAEIRNSAAVIEQGRLAGTYSKAFPREDGCTPGTEHKVWHRDGRCFGIAICNDLNHPQATEAAAALGATLICAPLNNMLRPHKADAWRRRTPAVLQGRARQAGCWIASADVTGPGPDGWISHGCTMIVRPDGSIASRVPEGEEGVALFELPPV